MGKASCPKCGGTFVSPTPTLIADFKDNDMRMATVKFRRSISYVVNGTLRNFFVAQMVKVNFSLIRALLEHQPDCLIFVKNSERDTFNAS